jgi:hypothetical protein
MKEPTANVCISLVEGLKGIILDDSSVDHSGFRGYSVVRLVVSAVLSHGCLKKILYILQHRP